MDMEYKKLYHIPKGGEMATINNNTKARKHNKNTFYYDLLETQNIEYYDNQNQNYAIKIQRNNIEKMKIEQEERKR